jgi:hypothetical protein
MAESIVASAPQIDDSSIAELLFMSVLLRFLDLTKRGQDFNELRSNFCLIKLAESYQDRFVQIQNLINSVRTGNCKIIEKNLECLKTDEYGIISAVRKYTMLSWDAQI